MKRAAWLGMVAAAALLASEAAAQPKPVTVRIGWNPFAGGTPIVGTMINEKLFEREAAKFGYQATPEWLQFVAGAPPANAAMVAGRLDMDIDFAAGAIVPRIKNKIPIVLFGVHASHLSNAVAVRPGSPVNDISQIAGKTVGLPIATSAHYTLASIAQHQLGKSLQELGVKLVNMIPAEGIKMPQGIDAAGVWVPLRFMGKPLGTAELLIDSSGFTGAGHKNGIGRAADVQSAWGYPEGYLIDRLYLCARDAFAKEHPNLLVAFLRARIEAQKIAAGNQEASLKVANEWWKLDPAVAAQARDTYPENTNIRNAPYMLEFDALGIIKGSEFFASIETIDKPITWDEVKAVIRPAAEMQRKAWEDGGSQPSIAQMEAHFKGSNPTWPQLTIAGGAPVWVMDQMPNWGQRHYKPGPFLVKK